VAAHYMRQKKKRCSGPGACRLSLR
jgi:hypothetical protein